MKNKRKKGKIASSGVFTDEQLNYFLTTLKNESDYPKVRNLQKLLTPRLKLDTINSILRYLKNLKQIEIDLDGNIIWIKEQLVNDHLSLADAANISQEFKEYYSKIEERK
ncbi:MAG TPA: hypothetical protein VH796_10225 [Nitrososphaeraceae archaeon]